MYRTKQILKNEDGFTLVEIIAVLIILGILAAVAIPKYVDLQDQARRNAAQSAISEVKGRLSVGYGQWLLEKKGVNPTDAADLITNGMDGVATLGSLGDDFTVDITTGTNADGDSIVTIHVETVDTIDIKAANVKGTWVLPKPY
ncbi:prepilin-type N-terminal cleavage/methylation domain-containing protein [Desulfobacterales bacterium HSG16]|nr:prepilin-type N-terminal cleavage/methylation domain-containing protein [Desulfobacterales bacterium HSG16]